jgi:hypothetical protein
MGGFVDALCSTRTVKVRKYLRRAVPATISRASLDELEQLPSSVLAGLHARSDWDEVTKDGQLRDWLAANPIPAPRAKASGPLFHGTLVFVQLVFQEPGQPPSGVSLADVQTARDYASIAIVTIQRYTSQYGPSSVSVAPDIFPFTANLTGDAFTQSQLEGWVDQCAATARDNKVSNPCIVVLHNRDLPGSPAFTGERDPFHDMTGSGTPYCYCLVFGEGLNVADNNHTIHGVPNENVYAHILSHEITEMVVDPKADLSNPEVCDGCAGNCNNVWFDLFDQNGVFLGGTAATASASGFAFFINAIVSGNAAMDSNSCIAVAGDRQTACVYPPPFLAGELLSYADDGTPGNVSAPALVGFGGWSDFKFLFAGQNAAGASRIYAVNSSGQLLSYADSGTYGNVSDPVRVGFGGWSDFKFLFAGQNAAGASRIYAVTADQNGQPGQLLSYGDDGTPGNVSDPVRVGFGGWSDFKFLFAGQNAAGASRIYAVTADQNGQPGQLLSYGDDGTPGNVSDPVTVGFDDWLDFSLLFAGRNIPGQNRIYAVPA